MTSEKRAKSFLIMVTIFLIGLIISPGDHAEGGLIGIILLIIAIPSTSYNIWMNYKRIPKIYSVLEIVVVIICAILLIYTIINFLT
ncbi:hypothetical protein LHA31_07695 [Carnobacterium viridans]|uniref:Uncharacterized protein n=1 Tax=Carnobacterium viridans TaxID=174587 RepID=A0A1H0ZTE6_9LACT|nr:hypothetical protein [Carnobacterium viridans]UDE94491.1 hypothetical protein LHA31_07695 [Carnobacterium viridans]SDQ30306.1 hypothetical protein SAMN04487752_1689 [Carnobacterium viridans]